MNRSNYPCFHTWTPRICKASTQRSPADHICLVVGPHEFHICCARCGRGKRMSYLTEDEFYKHLQYMEKAPYLAIDTEGTLNHPFSQTWGLSTSSQGVAEYFAFSHMIGDNLPREWLHKLGRVIENHPCLIFHHAKNDLRALSNLGINYRGKFYCTMLMAHMVNENIFSKELEYLTKMIGGEPKRNKEIMEKIASAFGWHYIPVNVIRPYGIGDASDTEDLFNYFYHDFDEQGFDGELWDWEQKLCRLLGKIEDQGILIDQELCQRETDRGTKIMKDIQEQLGFNPGSSAQLGKFLVEELNMPVLKRSKKTGKPSFDKFVMEAYEEIMDMTNDNRAKLIKIYRGWSKTIGSNYRAYLEHLSIDGRLRTNYKQHGTVTGRLSASWTHQVPKMSEKDWNGNLKQAFITDPDRTAWEIDYSQLEMRLKAAYAKEQKLLEIFADDNRDLFDEMAVQLNMDRDNVKTLNYTISYDGGAQRVSQVFGVSKLAAQVIISNYYKKWPNLAKFRDLALYRAKQNGYIQYWTGRRRHFQHESEYRLANSSAIQGGAFEIVKRSMIRTEEAGLNNSECAMDLQVHDSARLDIENGKEDEYLPEIKRIWENVIPDFGVRFKVDIKKWGTKEKYVEPERAKIFT